MAREQVKRKAAAPVEIRRGALVQNGERVAYDPWIVLNDVEEAASDADIVVSLTRFNAQRDLLLTRTGRLGVLIAAGEAVEEIGPDAKALGLVMVQFPVFRDGRGFTTARLLRDRYGYAGELRATGDVLEDQIFYMLRCGFDSFEIVSADPEAAFARASRTFTHAYQSAADARAPAHRLRAARNLAPRAEVVDLAAAARTPAERAARIARLLEGRNARDVLAYAAQEAWPGEFALVSSFGAESAVLLHMAASIDRDLPVIFLETDRHFAQTLEYRDALVARLGLTNVRNQAPDAQEAALLDADGKLWRRDPDACCNLRKVRPLDSALKGFSAWATGRKRFQGGLRADLKLVEHDGTHFKVNPLAAWSAQDIADYMQKHDLPAHPLVAQGFPSIGCWPCTKPAERAREGRWAGADKTECGIHIAK